VSGEPGSIRIENIVKRFGTFEAVKGISLEVKPGETFGLLGPNGAGKSTLIRMMTTLIPITSGKAWIDGHDVDAEPDAVRRCMGVIPRPSPATSTSPSRRTSPSTPSSTACPGPSAGAASTSCWRRWT